MPRRRVFNASLLIVLLSLAGWLMPTRAWPASPEYRLSRGQTLYVPAYSNVFTGPRKLPFQLAVTLSIRNTDQATSIQVNRIDYHDTNGKPVRRYLKRPLILAPLASDYVHIEEKDTSGGFAASFIVNWSAEREINLPIIECLMIGATSGQGISFVSSGREIRE